MCPTSCANKTKQNKTEPKPKIPHKVRQQCKMLHVRAYLCICEIQNGKVLKRLQLELRIEWNWRSWSRDRSIWPVYQRLETCPVPRINTTAIVRLATFRGAAEIMSNQFDWNTENCLQIVFYSIAQCGATDNRPGGGWKSGWWRGELFDWRTT